MYHLHIQQHLLAKFENVCVCIEYPILTQSESDTALTKQPKTERELLHIYLRFSTAYLDQITTHVRGNDMLWVRSKS